MFTGDKKFDRFFTGWFAFVVLLNLAILGFLGWAIYTLVTHFTG